MPAATIAILQATRLPLHLGSGRFKNEEPGASRTCHFAGRTPSSLSQVDRAFQNWQRRAAAGAGASLLFLNTRAAGWMRCRIGLRMKSCSSIARTSLVAPQTPSGPCRRRVAGHGSFGALLRGGSFHRRNRRVHGTALGGTTHDFRDRWTDSNRDSSPLASARTSGRGHIAGELFHCLVLVSRP